MQFLKRIGIYGGTFDPLHFGHINLALEILEKAPLDEVWFTPAQVNPHKIDQNSVSFFHRVNMLKLGLQPVSQFTVQEIEGQRPPPSYTLHTLQEIKKLYPQYHFYLVLGEDTITHFLNWYAPEQIVELMPILIGARYKNNFDFSVLPSSAITNVLKKGWIPTRMMDISSSNIRKRLAQNLYCGHLVPQVVLDYIQQNDLYK
jgi:nicotinate-nucleotide adenylyltransferase